MSVTPIINILVLFAFLLNTIPPIAHADELYLPPPGVMLNLSPAFEPVLMKGLKVHPENPFEFDFIIDTGNSGLKVNDPRLKEQSMKLIKYFLVSLTVPEKDLWVNLSPYEKNRIIAPNLGQTQMGRDMLAQDYILKQLTASLIYPEKNLGKVFWDKVYTKARQMYGTAQIPVNTFNKVWIVADKADVFERGNVAYVVGSHLKVMMEEDYLALEKHQTPTRGHVPERQPGDMFRQEQQNVSPSPLPNDLGLSVKAPQVNSRTTTENTSALASHIVREVILPAIEHEVNTGKNFASLRQMFYSMILASWYKTALKDAILTQIYGNQSKVKVGVNQDDPKANEEIFQRYLKAYKKGVFNYIKEDTDQSQVIAHKYFSGGTDFSMLAGRKVLRELKNPQQVPEGTFDTEGEYDLVSGPASIIPSRLKQFIGAGVVSFSLLGQHQALAAKVQVQEKGDKVTVVTEYGDTLPIIVWDVFSRITLTKEQTAEIIEKIKEENPQIAIGSNDLLAPKQRLDISAAIELARIFKAVNDSEVVIPLKLDNKNGKPTQVALISDSKNTNLFNGAVSMAFPDANYIFIGLHTFPGAVIRSGMFYKVFRKNSGWGTVYKGKSDLDIDISLILDSLVHEKVHIDMRGIMNTPWFNNEFWNLPVVSKFSNRKNRNEIAEEIAAYLGEISASEGRLLVLEKLGYFAEKTGPIPREIPEEHTYAGQAIKEMLAPQLKYLDYLIDLEKDKQRKQNPQGVLSKEQEDQIRQETTKQYQEGKFFSIIPEAGEEYSKWVVFINSPKVQLQLKKAADDLISVYYPGLRLLDPSSVKLPHEVLRELAHEQQKHLWNIFSEGGLRDTAFWEFFLDSVQKTGKFSFNDSDIKEATWEELRNNMPALRALEKVKTIPIGNLEEDLKAVIREAREMQINHSKLYPSPIPGVEPKRTRMEVLTPQQAQEALGLKGGIDLDRLKMQMNVSKSGQGIQMRFDPNLIAQIKANGFEGLDFNIQSIVPITNLRMLLGLESSV